MAQAERPRPDNALPFQRLSRTGYTSSITDPPLASGMVLPMIGKLLGHSKIQTTARYAHLARDSVKESAAWVAASIGADILARRLRDGCPRRIGTRRSARSQTVAPLRARRSSILSWSGRVASAGISLNRRSRPGSPVGVSSLGPALRLPGEIERSLGAGILSPPVGNRLRFCWKLALAFPGNGVVMSVSQYDP